MAPNQKHPEIAPATGTLPEMVLFPGFEGLEANFVLVPNQYLDVCLPNCSRGVVRLVGYLLRQTLGWLDANGEPLQEQVLVSYDQIIQRAGVSRGAIKSVLKEAVEHGFVRCVREARTKASGQASVSAMYELRWDDSGDYAESLDSFHGFYAKEGRRTPLPNQFFDHILPTEAHSVIKVVGAVLRHTVGFQTRYGGRRQHTALSYNQLQSYTQISRSSLAAAVAHAINTGYIRRLRVGRFSPEAEVQEASIYGVHWRQEESNRQIGSKIEPGPSVYRFKNRTRGSVQKSNQDRFNSRTRIGSKIEPEDRFKNRTTLNTAEERHLERQQQQNGAAADSSISILRKEGFDESAAEVLSQKATLEEIRQQVSWIEQRRPNQNRLGLLRRAIEEGWPNPTSTVGTSQQNNATQFAQGFYAGFHGNPDTPVAEPSTTDLSVGERYVARLTKHCDESVSHERLGRSFGQMVREALDGRSGVIISLASALRSHGDKFHASISKQQRAKNKRELAEAREVHEKAMQGPYHDYLAQRERELQQQEPERYAQFQERRVQSRRSLEKSPMFKRGLADALAYHDTQEARLRDLARSFEDHVLDFWPWDQQQNPNPFTP